LLTGEAPLDGGIACCALAMAMPNTPIAITASGYIFIGGFCNASGTEKVGLAEIRATVCLTYISLRIYPSRIYSRPMPRDNSHAPLTPAVLHILLALSTGPRHGYGIMKQVREDSDDKITLGPGTLYGSVRRMIDAGLIRESDKRTDPETDDERRIYYETTGLGQKTLAAELQRYRQIVAVAGRKRISPKALTYAS
jgi:DNA-binding PadR family transcriptional regulator